MFESHRAHVVRQSAARSNRCRLLALSTSAAPQADVDFRGTAEVLEHHRDSVGAVMWAITPALFRRPERVVPSRSVPVGP